MYKKIISLALAILMLVLSCVTLASCSKSDIPEGYQLVANDGDKFRLYVPTQGWMPNIGGGVTGAYYSITENTSINVYKPNDAAGLTLEEYWEKCSRTYKLELENYTEVQGISSNGLMLGGQSARKHIYTATFKMEGSVVNYKFMQILASFEGDIYVLTYSACCDVPEGNDISPYDKHIATFEGELDDDGNYAGVVPYFKFSSEPYVYEDKKEYPKNVDCPEGMKIISTNEHPYRFYAPNVWISDERVQTAAAYYSETDRSNVSIVGYMSGADGITVENYFEDLSEKYDGMFDEWTYTDNTTLGESKLGNLNARDYAIVAKMGGETYKIRQLIAIKGAMFYTFTYTSTEELYDSHMDDVNMMIKNFKTR